MAKMSTRINERNAHATVTIQAATNLFNSDGVDWPVSGDESKLAFGYYGMRQAGKSVNIWEMASN